MCSTPLLLAIYFAAILQVAFREQSLEVPVVFYAEKSV